VKVVLLCAGYATRLYPLTQDKPKALLPIQGKPILDRILDKVASIPGVEAAYVVTNQRFAENFDAWAAALQYPWPVKVVNDGTTSNENRLGAIGDLQFVLKTQKIGKEDILVIAGDNLFDFDVCSFAEFGKAKRPYPVIAIYDVKDREHAKRYGLVCTEADGRVKEFFEKPKDPPTTLASCGLYWLPAETRELIDKYLASGHNPDQPGHYMRWLSETSRLYSQNLAGLWFDIGDLESYQKANEIYGENIRRGKSS
jgi:glucose-1-phosphate thymidylyltransferase